MMAACPVAMVRSVEVRQPRVDDRGVDVRSELLPAYLRRSESVDEPLPSFRLELAQTLRSFHFPRRKRRTPTTAYKEKAIVIAAKTPEGP